MTVLQKSVLLNILDLKLPENTIFLIILLEIDFIHKVLIIKSFSNSFSFPILEYIRKSLWEHYNKENKDSYAIFVLHGPNEFPFLKHSINNLSAKFSYARYRIKWNESYLSTKLGLNFSHENYWELKSFIRKD